MHRASRSRLYPNQTQERQFIQLCGAGRFVYNEQLAGQKREYARFEAGEREKPEASGFDFAKRYARLKAQEGNEWLRTLSAVVVRGTGALPLGAAFSHFSGRIREGKRGKQAGFPRFKVKGKSRESFTIPQDVKIQAKRLWVPKVGWIRMNRKARSRTRGFGHIVLEELDVQTMRRSARGTREKPGRCVRAKAALNRKMAQYSCMGMVERFLQYKAWDLIQVPARNTSRRCAECGHVDEGNRKEQAHFRCLACGHTDNADLNAARNILDLGLNRLLAGGAPVTGRGEDNEAGAFFMECLVDTVNDPSTMQWNYRDRPEFHTISYACYKTWL